MPTPPPRATSDKGPCRPLPILATAEDRHGDLFTPLSKSLLDHLPQFLRELVAGNKHRGLGHHAGLVEVAEFEAGRILFHLLRLVAGRRADGLPCLAQSRRTFDEQPGETGFGLCPGAAEEEPLHNLPQPRLRLLGREGFGRLVAP